jgi:transcriptional regulator with XRE-family HTH domain
MCVAQPCRTAAPWIKASIARFSRPILRTALTDEREAKTMTPPDVPHYEGSLAVFLGDLRTWVFASQSKAAQHFGLTHSTISRYENGQLKPDPGYIACLARLLDSALATAGSEAPAHRLSILAEVDRALHDCYVNPAALGSWQELERLADSYRPQPTAPKQGHIDWGDAPDTAAFYGREAELSALQNWLTGDRCRLVAVAGLGGVGKTSLAARLVEQTQNQFECIVWRSLRNAPPLTDTVRSYLRGLQIPVDDTEPPSVERELASLLEALRQLRCLLVLDNVESILLTGEQAGAYREGYEGYGELLRRAMGGRHQSCLLLTTRELPAEVGRAARTAAQARVWHLDGLEAAEGARLLRDLGMAGSEKACHDMVARCSGNPLALQLSAELVRDVFDGDLSRYLSQAAQMPASIHRLLDQQIGRLSTHEQTLLAWLAVERAPVTPESLAHDVVGGAPGEIADTLQSLSRRSLVEHDRHGFVLQNVVLECATDRLVDQARREIMAEQPAMLLRVPLLKAHAPEHIRSAQAQQILRPLAAALLAALDRSRLAEKLARCLDVLRSEAGLAPGYGGGNLLNLLLHLGFDAGDYDFSGLTVWQAYLRNQSLQRAHLGGADLARSVFSDAFAGVNAVALSPDGKLLAVATNRQVQLWDLAGGRLVAGLADRPDLVWSVAFTPDSQMLISGGDRMISLWDVASTGLLGNLRGHTHWIWSVAVSPDGGLLASGSADHTIRLWSLADGTCEAVFTGHEGPVRAVAFSPDGTALASSSTDGTTGLWDVTERRLRQRWRTSDAEVLAVAFSPDGGCVAGGGARWLRDRLGRRDRRLAPILAGPPGARFRRPLYARW